MEKLDTFMSQCFPETQPPGKKRKKINCGKIDLFWIKS